MKGRDILLRLMAVSGLVLLTYDVRADQSLGLAALSDRPLAAFDAHEAMIKSSPFASRRWSFLGPSQLSGRANAVAVADRAGKRRIYAGYATGGVWKSDDDAVTWQEVFTREASTAILALAVPSAHPDIVWVGTKGAGVFKSLDAGRTWHRGGLTEARTVGRIVIDPRNPDIVYAAVGADVYAPTTVRGVFKTTDGGKSWRNMLHHDPAAGAIDLVMDPSDPETLYAVTWKLVRRPWVEDLKDAQSRIWKTTDGGSTWTESTAGLPLLEFRSPIGIDVSRSNPRVLYAFFSNREVTVPPGSNEKDEFGRPRLIGQFKGPEVYRSDDAAQTWQKVSSPSPGSYNEGGIRVDSRDENTVYTFGVILNVSHDGGKSFTTTDGPHADHRELWIDPKRPDLLYDCTDGGLYVLENGGASWRSTVVPTTQIYGVTLDMATPFHVYGAVQDYVSYRGVVDVTRGREALTAQRFEQTLGGEATSHSVDPTNSNVVYAWSGFQLAAQLQRADFSGQLMTRLTMPVSGRGEAAPRRNWIAPFVISPHDPKTIYVGYQSLFRSRDNGKSWERISSDLTDNDPLRIVKTPTYRPDYETISAIAESRKEVGLIFAGTDDGRLHVTRDGGRTWTEITKNLPHRAWVWRVVPSDFAAATVYVVMSGTADDDSAPYLYRSTDYGQSFTSIVANIPAGPVHVVREDPTDGRILYAGAGLGVYVSTNGGAHWDVLGGNLPTVPVTDLQIHPRDHVIVISTWGRGIWAMDAANVRSHK